MIGLIDGFSKWCKSIVRPIFRSSVTMPPNIASVELVGVVLEGPDIVSLSCSVVVCWNSLAELVGGCVVEMGSACVRERIENTNKKFPSFGWAGWQMHIGDGQFCRE